MKITRHNFIHATANAMELESTTKLFNADPEAFDMFSLFSYAIFRIIEGKNLTEDEYAEHVTNFTSQLVSDTSTPRSGLLKTLALLIFSMQIWNELEKMEKRKST